MNSKKPSPELESKGPEKKPEPAAGTSSGPGSKASRPGPRKPVLTEKQRAEARRQRRHQRQRGRRQNAEKEADRGNVLSRGLRASGLEIKRTFLFLGRSILSALDFLRPAGGLLMRGLLTAIALIGTGFRAIGKGIGLVFRVLGTVLLTIDRQVTPRRAIAFVGVIAAGILVASQFIDYRATEIGQPGYIAVESITHAPRVEQLNPTDSHSLLLVIAGLVALAASALSLFGGRRPAGIAMTAVGGLTIIVVLALDLPKALDVTDAALSYSGVKAVLLSGFWLEMAAGGVLTVTGLSTLLGRETASSPARRAPRPRPGQNAVSRQTDQSPGMTGSQA